MIQKHKNPQSPLFFQWKPPLKKISSRGFVIRTSNWLGDCALSVPALIHLKTENPEKPIIGLIPKHLVPFFKPMDLFTHIFPLFTPKGLSGEIKLLNQLQIWAKEFPFYTLDGISFPASSRSYIQLKFLKPKRILSFHPLAQTKKVIANRDKKTHESLLYFQLLSPYFKNQHTSPDSKGPLNFPFKPGLSQRVISDKQNRVPSLFLFPGAAFGTAKRYPPHLWAEVLNHIAEKFPFKLFLCGSPGERDLCQTIKDSLSKKITATLAAGGWTLPQTLGNLTLADLILCHDSGPMQVAGLFNLPLLSLFGSTDFTTTAPLGQNSWVISNLLECNPCKLRHCPLKEHLCMPGIPPQLIAQSALKILETLR